MAHRHRLTLIYQNNRVINKSFLHSVAGLDGFGKFAIRYGIVVVFLWIGALKFTTHEADGIVPFVANSPLCLNSTNTRSNIKHTSLKVVAYQDEKQNNFIIFNKASFLAERYSINSATAAQLDITPLLSKLFN